MDWYNDLDLVRNLIISHATKPQNIIAKDKIDINLKNIYTEKTITDSCTDDITVVLNIENEEIKDAKFYGVGCSISTATTDMILQIIKNKKLLMVKKLINEYLEMTQNGNVTDQSLLGDLIIYKNVYKQANRILCAQSSAKSIKKILESITK